MKRLTALAILVLLAIPLAALAHTSDNLQIDCEGWSASFHSFGATDYDLLITVNDVTVLSELNPPNGDFDRSGALPEGTDGTTTLEVFWKHLQIGSDNVTGPTLTVELYCETTTTTQPECDEDQCPTTTTQPETTTTQPEVQETTTTTAAPCPPGFIHQPPLCIDPSTTTAPPTTAPPVVPAPTTPAGEESLPFTGLSASDLGLIGLSVAAAGVLLLGLSRRTVA